MRKNASHCNGSQILAQATPHALAKRDETRVGLLPSIPLNFQMVSTSIQPALLRANTLKNQETGVIGTESWGQNTTKWSMFPASHMSGLPGMAVVAVAVVKRR